MIFTENAMTEETKTGCDSTQSKKECEADSRKHGMDGEYSRLAGWVDRTGKNWQNDKYVNGATQEAFMSKYVVLNLEDPIDKQLIQLVISAFICGWFGLTVIPFIVDMYKNFIG